MAKEKTGLHIYWVNPLIRNFGIHKHWIDSFPKQKCCHNIHLWFIGIGFYHFVEG